MKLSSIIIKPYKIVKGLNMTFNQHRKESVKLAKRNKEGKVQLRLKLKLTLSTSHKAVKTSASGT